MLSQAHRRSIHSSLTPILGEEEADALLAELPTSAESQPATKADLAELAASLRAEMHDLFRQMVMWVAVAIIGAMLGGMGVAAGIGAAIAG